MATGRTAQTGKADGEEIWGIRGKAVIENGTLKLWLLKQDERQLCFGSREGMPREPVEYQTVTQEEPDGGHLEIP